MTSRAGGCRGPRNDQKWHGVSVACVETGRVLKSVEIVDHAIGRISFLSPRRVVAGAEGNHQHSPDGCKEKLNRA